MNIFTELLQCSLCSLIQKPSLLNHSFKNKTICTTGISTGIIPMEKKKVGRKTAAQKKSSVTQWPPFTKDSHTWTLTAKQEEQECKQSDRRIWITLPLGESQLLWKINIYITILSWGNSWVTDEHRKQYCRGLYMCFCVDSICIVRFLSILMNSTQCNKTTITDVISTDIWRIRERGHACECTPAYCTL